MNGLAGHPFLGALAMIVGGIVLIVFGLVFRIERVNREQWEAQRRWGFDRGRGFSEAQKHMHQASLMLFVFAAVFICLGIVRAIGAIT